MPSELRERVDKRVAEQMASPLAADRQEGFERLIRILDRNGWPCISAFLDKKLQEQT